MIQELFRIGMYKREKQATTIVVELSDIDATQEILQWLHDHEAEIQGMVSKRLAGRSVQLTIHVCFAHVGDEERLLEMQEKTESVESVEY